ncbi:MAG TPA: D-erythronate dehydrogenase [Amnibacterium sp.]|jgi:nucleoside-diphosphate-sugar epimerase|uniref:D-erythronate dehydrogenase n=1 Tax=Amnibacterium sp. TaxID=1872496 RepID=UPI002F91C199
MRILITGGGGFVGSALARRILAAGSLAVGGAPAAEVEELVLADLVAPAPDLVADPRVRVATGDLATVVAGEQGADLVFHLAGVVSGAAEADFDLGMATNLDATRAVLEWCRRLEVPPVLVFSSSIAVFGHDPALPRIAEVTDDTFPRPQTSYGTQKLIGELLVADYARKGFVRGRSVRLMTVSVRPGRPNAAASGFLSGIIREPIAGERAVCPVPPDSPVALTSPRRTLEGLLRVAEVSDEQWGSRSAMTLPGITTTPRAMAAALDRVAGAGTSDLIDWREDPAITSMIEGWPAVFRTDRARALGLAPEESFDDIVRAYIDDLG